MKIQILINRSIDGEEASSFFTVLNYLLSNYNSLELGIHFNIVPKEQEKVFQKLIRISEHTHLSAVFPFGITLGENFSQVNWYTISSLLNPNKPIIDKGYSTYIQSLFIPVNSMMSGSNLQNWLDYIKSFDGLKAIAFGFGWTSFYSGPSDDRKKIQYSVNMALPILLKYLNQLPKSYLSCGLPLCILSDRQLALLVASKIDYKSLVLCDAKSFIDLEGNYYPCQAYLHYGNQGNIYKKNLFEMIETWQRKMAIYRKMCNYPGGDSCSAMRFDICAGGCLFSK